jgi:hypothetical protein
MSRRIALLDAERKFEPREALETALEQPEIQELSDEDLQAAIRDLNASTDAIEVRIAAINAQSAYRERYARNRDSIDARKAARKHSIAQKYATQIQHVWFAVSHCKYRQVATTTLICTRINKFEINYLLT